MHPSSNVYRRSLESRYPGTVGKVSTDRRCKGFSSTDDNSFWTVGIYDLGAKPCQRRRYFNGPYYN